MNVPNVQVSSANPPTVLSISLIESDHHALERILTGSGFTARCVFHSVPTLQSALPLLAGNQVQIVIAERDLGPETWKDVLAELAVLPRPPLLIVSSRIADEYLWAEALNLGAHDVLAKPYDTEEVIRVCTSAWLRWQNIFGLHRHPRQHVEMVA